MVTEEARLALEQLLQQKGEAENGRLLLKSVYVLSQTDLVREMTAKWFGVFFVRLFCLFFVFFFSFLFQRSWVAPPTVEHLSLMKFALSPMLCASAYPGYTVT